MNSAHQIDGVRRDTHREDGNPLIGEASISLESACCSDDITGNAGHDENDVL